MTIAEIDKNIDAATTALKDARASGDGGGDLLPLMQLLATLEVALQIALLRREKTA